MEKNLIQEAIFAAVTELNEVTTLHWDENSIGINNTNTLADVINIDSQCENNSTLARFRLRPGHILQPYHRKCLNDLTQLPAHTNTNLQVDAIEDQLHTSQNIFIYQNSSAQGYKNDYNSTVSVIYNPKFDGSSINNMKQITAKVFDKDGNVIVSLTTYVANIGEIDYYKRIY
jgi:hypothetical protein